MSSVQAIQTFNLAMDMIKSSLNDDIKAQLIHLSQIELKELANIDKERLKFFRNIHKILISGIENDDISTLSTCLTIISTAISLRSNQINQIFCKLFFSGIIVKAIWTVKDEKLDFLLSVFNELIRLENCNVDIIYLDTLLYAIEKSNSCTISNKILEILAYLEMEDKLPIPLMSLIKAKEITQKIMEAPKVLTIKYILLSSARINRENLQLFLKVAFRSISNGFLSNDLNSIRGSYEIIRYVTKVYPQRFTISEMPVVQQFQCIIRDFVQMLRGAVVDEKKKEFIRNLFIFLTEVLEYDDELLKCFEILNMNTVNIENMISKEGIRFLAILIKKTSNNVDTLSQSMLMFFSSHDADISCQIEYVKLLSISNENSDPLAFLEAKCRMFEELDTQEVNEGLIEIFVVLLDTLCELKINELLEKFFCLEITPYIALKALMMEDKEIIQKILKLASLDNFPRAKLALAMSRHHIWCDLNLKTILQSSNCSKISLKTIENIDETLSELKEKIMNHESEVRMKESDIIGVYNFKINCLQNQVDTACAALREYSNFNNETHHYLTELKEIDAKIQWHNHEIKSNSETLKRENDDLKRENQKVLAWMLAIKNKYTELRSKNEKIEQEHKKLKIDNILKGNKIADLCKKIEEEKTEWKEENEEQLKIISCLRQNLDFEKSKAAETLGKHEKVVDESKSKDKIINELRKKLKDAEELQTKVASLMRRN